MRLSIIIVNYNVKYFLEQCIRSIDAAECAHLAEVIVVDNNSKDGSVEMLRTRFPKVKLIVNDHNPGFSIANNQGLAIAQGEYILFLNPDTLVGEDTLKRCLYFMDQHPDAGALGVKLLDGAGQFLPESKRGLPVPFVAMCKALGLHHFFPKSATFNRYYLGHISEDSTAQIDVLCGAFMWMRKSVLDQIGGFDETFFMYGEDIDLSYRVLLAGYKVYYYPEVSIIHYKGESTKKSSLNYVKHFHQAMLIFANKHFKGYNYVVRSLLSLGVILGALVAVWRNVLNRVGFIMVDAALLVLIILIFKQFWAVFYYNDPDYYTSTFYFFNLPVYLSIWLGTMYFTGVYDKPYKLGRLFRSMFIGLLLNGVVYGLLDNDYRPSRMIMLVAFLGGTLAIIISRNLIYYITHKKWLIGNAPIKRVGLVGTGNLAHFVTQITSDMGLNIQVVGFIGKEEIGDLAWLGESKDLPAIVETHYLDELIFSLQDYSTSDVMRWMHEIGPEVHYKMLANTSGGIVGSKSKNSVGESYTYEIRYNLNQPEYKRIKRTFDIMLVLFCLILLPIWIILVSNRRRKVRDIIGILKGRLTWVGYVPEGLPDMSLPYVREGFTTLPAVPAVSIDAIRQINRNYAQQYQVWLDIEILIKYLWTKKKD
jgi:GT2 family glycosyltransferase